jgi:hypothetical protein
MAFRACCTQNPIFSFSKIVRSTIFEKEKINGASAVGARMRRISLIARAMKVKLILRGIIMVNRPGKSRFAFMDAGEAARRLSIDRVTLEQWVKEGRIKSHGGVGRDVFFRVTDIEALYAELHPETELAAAITEDEHDKRAQESATPSPTQKKQDPQTRVYLRLQADTKWYDISEADIRSWFQQLSPDGYERSKRNAEHTIRKLQFLISLIEEGQRRISIPNGS